MKTAIYVEDGVSQIVLTPENLFEKNAVIAIRNKISEVKVMDGAFYDCRGGWIRQSQHYDNLYGINRDLTEKQSIILRVKTDLSDKTD